MERPKPTTDADADADGRANTNKGFVRSLVYRRKLARRGFFHPSVFKPNQGDDDDAEVRAPGGAFRWCEEEDDDDDDARRTIVGATTGATRDDDEEDRRDVCGVGRGRRSA